MTPAVQFEAFTCLVDRMPNLLLRKDIDIEQAAGSILTVFLDGARRS